MSVVTKSDPTTCLHGGVGDQSVSGVGGLKAARVGVKVRLTTIFIVASACLFCVSLEG